MKKMRWTMIPIFTLIAMVCLLISTPDARADANLMENGSVFYTWIQEPVDLRKYIDNEGIYSSMDLIEKDTYSKDNR